jgi:hypothetical protein
VDDLVDSGDLDEATGHIFRFGATLIRFHRHQAQSIAKARTGQSYVVTTGTGSGKSLCFFVPIVDAIVRARKAGRPPKSSSQQPHSFRLVTPRNLGRPGRRCRQPVKNCGGLTKSASAWRRRYRLRSTS